MGGREDVNLSLVKNGGYMRKWNVRKIDCMRSLMVRNVFLLVN